MIGDRPGERGPGPRPQAGPGDQSHEGVDWLLEQDELPDLVFEATSRLRAPGRTRRATPRPASAPIDLTPAAVGPAVIPPVNLREHLDAPNVNMITCGGQATIPMVDAVSPRRRRCRTPRSSRRCRRVSAGPGTRANIDEFTRTTSTGVETIGGAERGKAIIILNPADPPMIMRDTIFCAIPEDADRDAIAAVDPRTSSPRCRSTCPATGCSTSRSSTTRRSTPAARPRSRIFVEVEGAGDYLPPYAGNLDIMTAAATQVGEEIARNAASRERSPGAPA